MGFGPRAPQPFALVQGESLLFRYDEGCPTELVFTVDSIAVLPPNSNEEDYPKVHGVEKVPEHAPPALAAAVPDSSFDRAFPLVANLLLTCGHLEVGHGSSVFGKAKNGEEDWLHCWGGGGEYPSYTSSIEGKVPFDDADEFWCCLEKGIGVQTGPNFPCAITKKTYRAADGSTQTKEVQDTHSSVHLRPFPASFPAANFPSEYHDDGFIGMGHDTGFGGLRDDLGGMKLVKMRSRWAFNFQLAPDWRRNDPPAFSFKAAFPKCARWLTHEQGNAHWLSWRKGVLTAYKTKNGMRKVLTPHCQTMKHDSVHAAFAELESKLQLPKSWGKK